MNSSIMRVAFLMFTIFIFPVFSDEIKGRYSTVEDSPYINEKSGLIITIEKDDSYTITIEQPSTSPVAIKEVSFDERKNELSFSFPLEEGNVSAMIRRVDHGILFKKSGEERWMYLPPDIARNRVDYKKAYIIEENTILQPLAENSRQDTPITIPAGNQIKVFIDKDMLSQGYIRAEYNKKRGLVALSSIWHPRYEVVIVDVKLKKKPDPSSEAILTIPANALIITTSPVKDGWVQIKYKNKAGFIKENQLSY